MVCKFADMEKMVVNNPNVLRYLMTDDLYIIAQDQVNSSVPEPVTAPEPVAQAVIEREIPSPMLTQGEESKTAFEYLGENNRYFLVLVHDDHADHIGKMHFEMLMKIIGAKGMELRDLAIMNVRRYPDADFAQLKKFFSCGKLVLFGINPARIGLDVLSVNVPASQQDTRLLATYSLEEMAGNTDKKRQFWNIMKDF